MSRVNAARVASDLNNQPSYMADTGMDGRPVTEGIPAIEQLATAIPTEQIANYQNNTIQQVLSAYGLPSNDNTINKAFPYSDGVAVIPIHGMLVNRLPYSWGFVTGYNYIRQMVGLASTDPDVKLIVYDVDTCGGVTAGCQETADVMYAARDLKPSVAVIDSKCFSAGYFLACSAGKIVLTPSGGCGNIGVLLMRFDYSAALQQSGTKINLIIAGAHKADGYPVKPMDAGEEARLQHMVDTAMNAFVAAVVRGRDLTEEFVRATEADAFNADDALQAGLIDVIMSPPLAIQAELDCIDSQENDEMATAQTPEQIAEAAAALTAARQEAATAERARITGILNCAEATGRGALANHLATATDLSVEAAQGILKAAPAEAAAAVAPAPKAAEQPANPLAAAMATRDPKVPVVEGGGTAAGGGTEPSSDDKTVAILSAYVAKTGASILKREVVA